MQETKKVPVEHSYIKWKKRWMVWDLPIFKNPQGLCWKNQPLWSCATAARLWQS